MTSSLVGSEMCIRDRKSPDPPGENRAGVSPPTTNAKVAATQKEIADLKRAIDAIAATDDGSENPVLLQLRAQLATAERRL
eukprot:387812-Prorocentrum_lima.AAC.1